VDLAEAQDDRQFLLTRRARQIEGRPLALERLLVEELEATPHDRVGAGRYLFLVRAIPKILAQFFFGDQIRRLGVILRQVFDGAHIAILRLGGQALQLQIFDQALA
jgi:hypothetical protein